MTRPLYIFDLDGTLALIEHRRPLATGPTPDWPAFFAACVDDVPNDAVIDVMLALYHGGAEIWIWSGRSDEVREQTETWLAKHGASVYEQLRMRPAGDHQPDEKLKAAWLDGLSAHDRGRIAAVFEDRNRMVALWRSCGLPCFQVAPGDF